jgi:hypothetical protein
MKVTHMSENRYDVHPLDNVTLPDLQTDNGTLVRLLIAESLNPGSPAYIAADVTNGMQAMKAVVDNRLNHNPSQFGAPGATNYRQIIAAPGQFAGFSMDGNGNVVLSDQVNDLINAVMTQANTGGPGPYSDFVQNALGVCNALVNDPFSGITNINGTQVTGGGYGWRTLGSSDPGGHLIAIPAPQGGIIANNQFYTLISS